MTVKRRKSGGDPLNGSRSIPSNLPKEDTASTNLKAGPDPSDEPLTKKIDKRGGNPFPRQGPGMFDLDPRAGESTARVLEALSTYPTGETSSKVDLEPTLKDICRYYWSDHDYDKQTTFGEAKLSLKPIVHAFSEIGLMLKSLSKAEVYLLNTDSFNEAWPGSTRVIVFEKALKEIEAVGNRIVDEEFKGGAAVAVKRCCKSLWRLRERITGQPFKRNFTPARQPKWTDKETALREFAAPDAQFVLVTMQAIDSRAQFATIRTALTELSKAQSAKARASGADPDDHLL